MHLRKFCSFQRFLKKIFKILRILSESFVTYVGKVYRNFKESFEDIFKTFSKENLKILETIQLHLLNDVF